MPRATKADKELLARGRRRFKIMAEADQDNRRYAMDDLKFVNVPGQQWDDNMTQQRGKRPCYEFNKLRPNGKRVINDIRANRPMGKVRPVEGGDKETAELYEGLIRNIWNASDGDTIVDNAAEYQVDAGMGAWRITTEYSDDTAFDQDICLESIKNPFCLYADPACQDVMKRDAEDWLLTERISKQAFEDRYGKKAKRAADFEGDFADEWDDEDEWETDEQIRIAEYWWKERYDKEIWLVNFPQEDGTTRQRTVDSTTDEAAALLQQPDIEQRIVKRRTARCWKIRMVVMSGDAILEGPVDWAGREFPFVMIYGEYKVIDGKPFWWGLHRFSKDAQRSFNVSRTAIDEAIASAPKSKYWATPTQAEGLTEQWARANDENLPFQLYNHDSEEPGAPKMMAGPQVPVALIQQAQIASQDIRDTSGLHEASFGEESSEKSGIALARKQAQAEIVTYNFPDNIAKGISRTWEILIDLIPEIYDARRELRILGADGKEDYVTVNDIVQDPTTGKAVRVNDLSVGRYDVAITIGPNYTTRRQEAAEAYSEMASAFPQLMGVAGDLVVGSYDLPYSDEIAERLQTLLPPNIQQMIAQGKDLPPEVTAAMARVDALMEQVQEHGKLVQQAAQEAQAEQSEADKSVQEVKVAVADLERRKADFEAMMTKRMADLKEQEAQIASQDADSARKEVVQGVTEAREALASDMTNALQEIQRGVAEFMQQSLQTLADVQARGQPNVTVPPQPRISSIELERSNGKTRAVPVYEQ